MTFFPGDISLAKIGRISEEFLSLGPRLLRSEPPCPAPSLVKPRLLIHLNDAGESEEHDFDRHLSVDLQFLFSHRKSTASRLCSLVNFRAIFLCGKNWQENYLRALQYVSLASASEKKYPHPQRNPLFNSSAVQNATEIANLLTI